MKTIVKTEDAPQAIGPYSQAVKAGDTLFCSGQIALLPEGKMLEGDVSAQTEQVLLNLEAVLKAGGATFENVVRTTIFLKSMNDFAAVNAVYETRFKNNPPARACVEVSRLPKDVDVEIDAIAYVAPEST